jgi:hypothetical protein
MKKILSIGFLITWSLICSVAVFLRAPSPVISQEELQENPVIGYHNGTPDDPVARLQKRIDQGEVKLEFVPDGGGYLPSVLKLLQISVSSQGLVFSKTSFQSPRIFPSNPRAVYFNDDVYVGYVRGGDVLELAAADPKLGGVFYRLDQVKTATPKFVRDNECLQCHVSNATKGVPGFQVRSVYPDHNGYPLFRLGSHVTNDSTPFEERWGGWYVTGTHGDARHAGNMIFTQDSQVDKPEQFTGGNLTSLEKRLDLSGYVSPHSDIVALMVLEHQTQMHNLLAKLNYQTRIALHDDEVISRALGREEGKISESTQRRIEQACDEVIKYMLFVNAAKLPSEIKGTSNFAKEFGSQGPKDRQGRSLRDLELRGRLFRYPCSYLVYSESFDSLPKPALDIVYQKLWQILTGQIQEKPYSSLSAADRKAILEILRETKRNLPSYYWPSGRV